MARRHILIYGKRGAGKSTLIERLLELCDVPVYGFFTRSTPRAEDGFHSIYIHPAGVAERVQEKENHIGDCNGRQRTVHSQVFDTLGVEYLQARPDGILVMDELGFMESESKRFCEAVLQCLDGDIPVLASVKEHAGIEFLEQVRSHPNTVVYTLNETNREGLFQELAPVILHWNDAVR